MPTTNEIISISTKVTPVSTKTTSSSIGNGHLPKGIMITSDGKVVTTFYKQYWKGKEPLAEKSGRTTRTLTPFEQAGNNIMITIKTTQSYHRTRVQVLLDTWISAVNASNVFLVTDGNDEEYEGKAKNIGKCIHVKSKLHYNYFP